MSKKYKNTPLIPGGPIRPLRRSPSGYLSTEKLDKKFIFRERQEIVSFIASHPFLVSLLLEAEAKIKVNFPDSSLSLQVIADPESVGEAHLTLFIATGLSAEQALEKLEALFDSWWLATITKLPQEQRGVLNINVEFR